MFSFSQSSARPGPACLTLILAVLILFPAVGEAQALTFQDFLTQAYSSTPAGQQALHEEEIASQGVRSARARLLPWVDSSASITHNDRRIEIPLPDVPGVDVDTPVFQYQDIARLGISAGVPLLEPAALAGLRAARTGAQGATAQRQTELLAVERSAVEVFAQWYESDRLYRSASQRLELAQAHRAQLQAMLNQGTATTLDLRRTELAVVEAELALTTARNTRDAVAHNAALIISSDATVALTGTLPPPPDEPTTVTTAAALRVTQAETATRAAGLGYAPRIVATANANWVSAPYIDDRDYAWQVQAALQWTLFAGGARHAAQRVAQEREAQAALALHTIENTQLHQRQLAQTQTATAAAQRAAAAQRLQLSADVAALTRQSFELGVATSTDVLQAEFALADAEAGEEIAAMAETLAAWRVRWAGLDAALP